MENQAASRTHRFPDGRGPAYEGLDPEWNRNSQAKRRLTASGLTATRKRPKERRRWNMFELNYRLEGSSSRRELDDFVMPIRISARAFDKDLGRTYVLG